MKTIIGYESPIVPPPEDYKGNFFEGKVLINMYSTIKLYKVKITVCWSF